MKILILILIGFFFFTYSGHLDAQDSTRWISCQAGYEITGYDNSPVWVNHNTIRYSGYGNLWPNESKVQIKPFKKNPLIVGVWSSSRIDLYLPVVDSTIFARASVAYGGSLGYVFRRGNFFMIPLFHAGHRKGVEWIKIQDKPGTSGNFKEPILTMKDLNSWGAGAGIQTSWVFYKPFILSASFRYLHYWEKDGLIGFHSGLYDETSFIQEYAPNKNVVAATVTLGLFIDEIPFLGKN